MAVPQLSGRGLGHTGGTLDKLESIPGWRAALSNDEMFAQLRDVGAVICAAGSGLAPADKKLYALRDVTGTVEAIPLIASSIMSKKIAEGTDSLVLDVKFGSGAFMRDVDRARELARTMVALGTDSGVATTALLTDMNTPLGLAIGNANEVRESVEVLAGGGPADVVELTVALAREMLALAGQPDADVEAALQRRPRDGRLARHDPRAGRRSGCRAPRAARDPHRHGRRRPAYVDRHGGAAVRHRRLASGRRARPGAGPRRSTPPASICTSSPATRSPPDSRCSPCSARMTRASSARSTRSTGAWADRRRGAGRRVRSSCERITA